MRNAITGFFMIMILILAGASINTIHGRNMRQNELDSSLASSMQDSMEALINHKDMTNKEEFIADFIQSSMVKMHGDGKFTVTIYAVDVEKGFLDAGITEEYTNFFKTGKVSARRQILVDDFTKHSEALYEITFRTNKNIIKQIQVQGGTSLNASMYPNSKKYEDGFYIEGHPEKIYRRNDLNSITAISDITFISIYNETEKKEL